MSFELDLLGLKWPHPLMVAKRKLRLVKLGHSLKVLLDDYNSFHDIISLFDDNNLKLMDITENEGVIEILVRRTKLI